MGTDSSAHSGSAPTPPSRRTILLLVAVWIGFAALYSGATLDESRIYFGGDQAELLRKADETLRGRPPLVGAHSRGGLFHPGPLFVYVLAGVQALTGHREAVTLSVLSVLCSSSLLFLSLLTLRLSRSAVLAAVLPLLFVFNFTYLIYLRFLWNVTIVIPALAAAYALLAALDTRRAWVLPALAAVLALAAQAHMGFVPLVGWLGCAALGRVLLEKPRERARELALAAGVLVLAFAPVLWEAAVHEGGNLAKIAARFTSPSERHPLPEVFAAVDRMAAEILPGGPGVRLVLLAGSLLALAAATLRREAFRREPGFQLVVLAGSWIVFLMSVRAIPEPIETYYLRPVWILMAATVISGASALLSFFPTARARSAAGWVCAGLVLASVYQPALETKRRFAGTAWNSWPLSELREVAQAIRTQAGSSRASRVRLEYRPGDLGGGAPSVDYLLGRLGVERTDSADAPRLLVAVVAEETSAAWIEVLRTERFRLLRPRDP